MKLLHKKSFGTTLYMAFGHSLLFCCFFLYIWLFGDTRLIYHAFGRFVDYPAFFTGWEFFGEAIDHPGGIAEYVTGFLSQLYYYQLGGAIVITIVVGLTCLATGILVSFAGFNFLAGIVGYTPAIFFLAMHSKCEHSLGVFVGLLLSLWVLVAYAKIPPKSFALRGCCFLLMFVLLYLAAGAWALLFGILAAGFEVFIRRRLLSACLCVLLTGLVPLIVGWCFDLRMIDIYLYLLPFDPRISLNAKAAARALQISMLSILLTAFVLQFFFSRKTSGKESRKKSKETETKTGIMLLKWVVQALVVVSAAVVTVNRTTGIEIKRLQADYYAGNGMWSELLEYADRFPVVTYDADGNHNIIQALYHTGKLGDELFRYPQHKDGMFLPSRGGGIRGYQRGISYVRLSLLLGNVNIAEKEAYELFENSGEYPELLWNLAIINIAKKQPKVARVFLEVLSRDVIHGKKAKNMLRRLAEDHDLNDDKEIIRLRSVMLTEDTVEIQTVEPFMLELLEVNPHNRFAFEYLMVYYLKSKQVGKIAKNMYRFRDFGYTKVPRHFGEAILLHLGQTREHLDSHGWEIDPQTYKTGEIFMAALKLNPVGRPESARNLAPQFRNTYYYYYMFNQSGVRR
ncbi:MAG: DUF6057 family protein [Phycisphaerae bacterium]|nr:DUF6057 family protein [Phycisphaerae bacterium]